MMDEEEEDEQEEENIESTEEGVEMPEENNAETGNAVVNQNTHEENIKMEEDEGWQVVTTKKEK